MAAMRKYPDIKWQRLGRWVHDTRLQAGLSDMDEWARVVGRSTRQLRGLERGEPVGPKTIELVAEALGVEAWYLFGVLAEDEVPSGVNLSSVQVARMRRRYEDETGLGVQPPAVGIRQYDDRDLLDELARRLGRARIQASGEEGGSGGDTAPKTQAEGSSANDDGTTDEASAEPEASPSGSETRRGPKRGPLPVRSRRRGSAGSKGTAHHRSDAGD